MHQQGYLTAAQYTAALAQRLVLCHRRPACRPGATVVYPDQSAPDRVPRLRRLRDRLAARPLSRRRRCTAAGCGCRPPWIRPCRPPPTPPCARPCPGPADPAGDGPGRGRAADRLRAGPRRRPGLRARHRTPTTTWPSAAATRRPARAPTSRWPPPAGRARCITGGGAGPPARLGVEAVRAGHRLRAGHPARGRPTTPPASTRSPAAQVPAGQPASACQIHNDEPGSILGTVPLAEATGSRPTPSTPSWPPRWAATTWPPPPRSWASTRPTTRPRPFYYCQSYALGEVDVSPLDMASAYGVFADHGQRATPTPILEIVNAQGKVLVNNIKPLAARRPPPCRPTWPTT